MDEPPPREIIEMPIATGQQEPGGHCIGSPAFFANLVDEPRVFGPVGASIKETKSPSRWSGPLGDGAPRRKISEMPIAKGQKKPGGPCIGIPAFFANLEDEPRVFGPIGILFDLEQTRIELGQRAAT